MTQSAWESFSTAGLRAPQIVPEWNRFTAQTLGPVEIQPLGSAPFAGTISRIAIGPLGLIRVQSTPARATALQGGVGRWASSDNDSLLLVLSEGERVFQECGKALKLERGDLFIRDLTKPWAHDSLEKIDRLMIKIPYSALLSRVSDPSLLAGQTFPATNPMVAMAVDVIRSIYRTLETQMQTELGNTMAGLILDCLKMLYDGVVAPNALQGSRQQRSVIRRDAMNYINSNLADPELSVGAVSRSLGIGPRSLQRAFLDVGQSPASFIRSQRLDRAAALLSRGGLAQGGILVVAMSVGFNDASYFSRSFSQKFGMCPRSFCTDAAQR